MLRNYSLDWDSSNGSNPVSSLVNCNMEHNEFEVSIPAGKTYEPLSNAVQTFHHSIAPFRDAVPCVTFMSPVDIQLVRWVNNREKYLRSSCFPNIVPGNRLA